MPSYDYQCEDCGHRFEKFQKMSDEPVKKCPNCGGATRRLFGKVGLIFKGSGFYSTDYKNIDSGSMCCGRTERCEKPPCSDDGDCRR